MSCCPPIPAGSVKPSQILGLEVNKSSSHQKSFCKSGKKQNEKRKESKKKKRPTHNHVCPLQGQWLNDVLEGASCWVELAKRVVKMPNLSKSRRRKGVIQSCRENAESDAVSENGKLMSSCRVWVPCPSGREKKWMPPMGYNPRLCLSSARSRPPAVSPCRCEAFSDIYSRKTIRF